MRSWFGPMPAMGEIAPPNTGDSKTCSHPDPATRRSERGNYNQPTQNGAASTGLKVSSLTWSTTRLSVVAWLSAHRHELMRVRFLL